jgi:hypothetical protein
LKRLRKLRQTGLDTAGEYSIENLAFKHLRNKGLIDRLKEMLRQTQLGQMVLPNELLNHWHNMLLNSEYYQKQIGMI